MTLEKQGGRNSTPGARQPVHTTIDGVGRTTYETIQEEKTVVFIFSIGCEKFVSALSTWMNTHYGHLSEQFTISHDWESWGDGKGDSVTLRITAPLDTINTVYDELCSAIKEARSSKDDLADFGSMPLPSVLGRGSGIVRGFFHENARHHMTNLSPLSGRPDQMVAAILEAQ